MYGSAGAQTSLLMMPIITIDAHNKILDTVTKFHCVVKKQVYLTNSRCSGSLVSQPFSDFGCNNVGCQFLLFNNLVVLGNKVLISSVVSHLLVNVD